MCLWRVSNLFGQARVCLAHAPREMFVRRAGIEQLDLVVRPLAHPLRAWSAATANAGSGHAVLDQVRDALDDDLDTPTALAAIDAAAAGADVTAAAALIGVDL